MTTPNLFVDLPERLPDELITTVLESSAVRIERIVSQGQSSPPGFWYDQPQNEWVLVLRGAGRLCFDGRENSIELKPGDFVSILAHQKHRVEWTTPEEPTIWLAIHYA